jgi:hypothetical protein
MGPLSSVDELFNDGATAAVRPPSRRHSCMAVRFDPRTHAAPIMQPLKTKCAQPTMCLYSMFPRRP